MKCKNCRWYRPHTTIRRGGEYASPLFGNCIAPGVFVDTNETGWIEGVGVPQNEGVPIHGVGCYDAEGYKAGAYVGAEFGCIHFMEIKND